MQRPAAPDRAAGTALALLAELRLTEQYGARFLACGLETVEDLHEVGDDVLQGPEVGMKKFHLMKLRKALAATAGAPAAAVPAAVPPSATRYSHLQSLDAFDHRRRSSRRPTAVAAAEAVAVAEVAAKRWRGRSRASQERLLSLMEVAKLRQQEGLSGTGGDAGATDPQQHHRKKKKRGKRRSSQQSSPLKRKKTRARLHGVDSGSDGTGGGKRHRRRSSHHHHGADTSGDGSSSKKHRHRRSSHGHHHRRHSTHHHGHHRRHSTHRHSHGGRRKTAAHASSLPTIPDEAEAAVDEDTLMDLL